MANRACLCEGEKIPRKKEGLEKLGWSRGRRRRAAPEAVPPTRVGNLSRSFPFPVCPTAEMVTAGAGKPPPVGLPTWHGDG